MLNLEASFWPKFLDARDKAIGRGSGTDMYIWHEVKGEIQAVVPNYIGMWRDELWDLFA